MQEALLEVLQASRSIAGRTVRCRCKFQHKFYNGCAVFLPQHGFLVCLSLQTAV